MQEGKRKRQGKHFHICHWCKRLEGFWGKLNARFCCVGCRSANCKLRAKLLVKRLEDFFKKIGFNLQDLLDFRERFFNRLVDVASLLGYSWDEWDREWVKT